VSIGVAEARAAGVLKGAGEFGFGAERVYGGIELLDLILELSVA